MNEFGDGTQIVFNLQNKTVRKVGLDLFIRTLIFQNLWNKFMFFKIIIVEKMCMKEKTFTKSIQLIWTCNLYPTKLSK